MKIGAFTPAGMIFSLYSAWLSNFSGAVSWLCTTSLTRWPGGPRQVMCVGVTCVALATVPRW